jgi:hypothetical protein
MRNDPSRLAMASGSAFSASGHLELEAPAGGRSIPEMDEKPLARPLRICKYLMPGISVPALREAADLSGRDSIFCDRAG